MNFVIRANLFNTLAALTAACDLINHQVRHHSERVAYIAVQIGIAAGLDQQHLEKLVLTSLLHDIGVISTHEKIILADLNTSKDSLSPHCKRGYELIQNTSIFANLSEYVLAHHDYYHDELHIIPAIIHVADRVEILLQKERYCLWQVDYIVDQVKTRSGTVFHPLVVDCFVDVADKPSFWLDLENEIYRGKLVNQINLNRELSLDELQQVADLFAIIVDTKSSFTATHSTGLATKINILTDKLGMNQTMRKQMYIAALLHDLGKLAVPEDIITFPGKLDKRQMQLMQQHTYHTYHLIGQFGEEAEKMQQWAAYHHERLDGSGYPFRLYRSDLDQNSRLMAIADVTQAVMEDRPYRAGMPHHKIVEILRKEGKFNRLDSDLVDFVIENLDLLNKPVQTA